MWLRRAVCDNNLLRAVYASQKLIIPYDRGANISRNLKATSKFYAFVTLLEVSSVIRTDNLFKFYGTQFNPPSDLPYDSCIAVAILLCQTSSWCHVEGKFYDVAISDSGFNYRTIYIFKLRWRCETLRLYLANLLHSVPRPRKSFLKVNSHTMPCPCRSPAMHFR
jgi:hypothetical protein